MRRSTIEVHPTFPDIWGFSLNPLRTAVPFWGQTIWNLTGLSQNGTAVLKGLRSSLPRRENWLQRKSSFIPMTKSHGPKHTVSSCFFDTRLTFRRFWVEKPRHSENSLAKMCYLYRRTPPRCNYWTGGGLLPRPVVLDVGREDDPVVAD